ncbi:MAG: c-type cytochrome, partial [Kiloniellaceae bacterium]
DGRIAASAGWDRTVRLWDLRAQAPRAVLNGHRDNVNAVAFSPDGQRLLSGSYDATLKLWRVSDGQLLETFTGHEFGVSAVAFAPDGRRAVSASADDTVRIWNLETGDEIASLVGHEKPVFGVAVSADGRLAASGGADRTVMLWDLASGSFVRAFYGHGEPVWSLAFTPDGRRLLSAGSDEVVRVWDLETGEEIDALGRRRLAVAPTTGVPAAAAEADPRGAKLFRKCAVCHSVQADGRKRAGPTLYGLFGRRAGSVPGYNYSQALRESDLVWTEATVNALFAEGPHVYTPGSKMPLQRMPSAEDRRDLIAYLKRITAAGE